MKHLINYSIILFVLLISCKQEVKVDSIVKEQEKNIAEISVSEQYFENDTLLTKFESDLIRFSKNPKFKLEKELVENRHVDDQVDTIKIFHFGETNIKFYKAVSEEWIFEAKIMDSGLEFSESVKIKMKKNALEKILKTKLNSNIVKIGNLEQTSVFVFKFENNNLQEIIYEGYVD